MHQGLNFETKIVGILYKLSEIYYFKSENTKFHDSNFEPLLSTFFLKDHSLLLFVLMSPPNYCISRKDNRNESRSLVPNYFKIGPGNQWLQPVSATCDFRISHCMANSACSTSPLRCPGLELLK